MNWCKYRLGDHVEIKHGFAFKGEFFSDEPTSNILITPGNFKIGGGFKNDKLKYYNGEIPEEYILSPNDLIVTMTDLSKLADTLGYSAKIPEDKILTYLHNQRIGLVNLKSDDLDSDFLYWLLRSEHYQRFIAGSATGATVKHTSPTKIYAFKFKAPPEKRIQQKIGHILSAYDDLIENNLKRIKLLEEMAQITYDEWFVRMKFPGHENTPVDAETGLPDGWESWDLKTKILIKHGYAYKGEFFSEVATTRVLLTPGNIKVRGGIKLDKIKYYDESAENPEAYILDKHDLLVTMTDLSKMADTLGYPLLVPSSGKRNYLHNQRLGKVLPIAGVQFPKYFYYMLFKDERYRAFVVGSSSGATVKHTSPKKILSYKPNLPLLGSKIIQDFNNFVSPLYQTIDLLLRKNEHLQEARDILLPRLMTGLINVDDIGLPTLESN